MNDGGCPTRPTTAEGVRVTVTTRVTLQYMPDCPNWQTTHVRLRQALRTMGLEDCHVQLVEVSTWEQATTIGFRGSPTVLINGLDPFADDGAQVGLTCRMFVTPDGRALAPTVEQLVGALAP
jgi:hypothetical protein